MLILRLLLAGRGKPQKWCGESWARGWQEAQHLPVPSVHSSREVSEEPHVCPCGFSNESCPRRWQLTWEGAAEGAEGLLLCGSQLDAVSECCFLFFLTTTKLCKSSPECQPAPAACKGSALASVLFLPTGEKSLSYFFVPKRGTGNRLKGRGAGRVPRRLTVSEEDGPGLGYRLSIPSLPPLSLIRSWLY